MLKYIEYVYLTVGIGLVAILMVNYSSLTTVNLIAFVVGIALSAFMFSFRRKQRKIREAQEAERIKDLEESIKDDD